MLEELFLYFSELSFMQIFVFAMGTFATAVFRFIYRQFSNQEFFSTLKDVGRVKNILVTLGKNQARLDASSIFVTRLHNGSSWLNGKHRLKLSIQNSLTVFETSETFLRLRDAEISELDEILIKVEKPKFDVISVSDLPDDFEFKKVLRRDKFHYIVLFKIEKSKQTLGYLWFLFSDTNIPNYDKDTYSEIIGVTANIAAEFA